MELEMIMLIMQNKIWKANTFSHTLFYWLFCPLDTNWSCLRRESSIEKRLHQSAVCRLVYGAFSWFNNECRKKAPSQCVWSHSWTDSSWLYKKGSWAILEEQVNRQQSSWVSISFPTLRYLSSLPSFMTFHDELQLWDRINFSPQIASSHGLYYSN